MVRNGEREREMKTDGGWIERGQMGCRGVGSGTRQREGRRTTARGGGFEWFSCSGTVTEIGRSYPFSWRFACRDHARVTPSFRLFRFVSFRLVSSPPLTVHRRILSPPPPPPPPLASDQTLGSSTGRAVHAAFAAVFPFSLLAVCKAFQHLRPANCRDSPR